MAQKQLAVRQKLRQSKSTNPCLLVEKLKRLLRFDSEKPFLLEKEGLFWSEVVFFMYSGTFCHNVSTYGRKKFTIKAGFIKEPVHSLRIFT